MDAGVEVKVEDYDGTYVCLFCGESVRGQPALKCGGVGEGERRDCGAERDH